MLPLGKGEEAQAGAACTGRGRGRPFGGKETEARMRLRLRTYAGATAVFFAVATGCAPVAPSDGSVTLRLHFADGRVETRSLAASSVRLEGCRDVQRLQIDGTPEAGDRLWAEILIGADGQAEPLRLAYAGALTEGGYASWDALSTPDGGPLSQQYDDPRLYEAPVPRPVPQPVSVTVAVDAPWAAAPDLARVGIEVEGAFRAAWWLNSLRAATVYCDQVAGTAQ